MRTVLLALLFAAQLHAADFRLDRELESLTGTHRHYTQYIDGIPVDGAGRVESVLRGGRVRAEERVARAPLVAAAARKLSAPRKDAALVYLNIDGEARLAWRFVTSDHFAHWLDAATGETLKTEQLFWTATSRVRVFDVNPVAQLNNPSFRDQNNAADAVPLIAYTEVDLFNVNDSGPLGGPNAVIVDAEGPQVPPVEYAPFLLFLRNERAFEDVNAYFQIDRSLRYIQSLGYTGSRRIIDYPLPIDPHAAGGADNSYYIPSAVAGRGTLFFGEGGTDDAEDSDIMLHELGHAIEDWIAPGTFGGASSSESRALSEGFGDYWAFSSTYEATARSGRDPFCIADWDARCGGDDPSQQCGYAEGADCLRRVDSAKTMANYIKSETAGTEHRNGEIWSSALREIFLGIGKSATDTIVLESHFGVPPNPTFAVMARRMLDADFELFGGTHEGAICLAMSRHGISGCSTFQPRGQVTWLTSGDQGIPIPDNDPAGITSTITVTDTRQLASLAVHVDIAHPARGDLRILLTAPDGRQLLLQDFSLDRTPNLRGTFGRDILPAQPLDVFNGRSALGTWTLTVADVLAHDSGTLRSWSLVAQFAGDEPLPTRPIAVSGFPSRFIPVVANLAGAGGARWASDVQLFNRGPSTVFATLIFTPAGANGLETFAAVKTEIPSGQTVVLEDVVAQVFGTLGSGTLEVQGDVRRLVIWSNTYDRTRGVGQSIRAVASGDAISATGSGVYLVRDRERRLNVGFAEIGGGSGTIMTRILDPAGNTVTTRLTQIGPFSQFQLGPFPFVEGVQSFVAINVVDGDAQIVAYGSYLDVKTGDPLFVRATRAPARRSAIPAAIDAPGAFGSHWQTSLTYVRVNQSGVAKIDFYPATGGAPVTNNAIGTLFAQRYLSLLLVSEAPNAIGHLELDLPAGSVLSSNLVHRMPDGGTFGEHIDEVRIEDALGTGGAADALNVTSSEEVRTNFGIAEVGGGTATVDVRLFDTSGAERARTTVTVGPHQLLQLPLSALYGAPILHGVLDFRVREGDGRVIPYASVVNNGTNDFFFSLGE